jgi:hypothetical protein
LVTWLPPRFVEALPGLRCQVAELLEIVLLGFVCVCVFVWIFELVGSLSLELVGFLPLYLVGSLALQLIRNLTLQLHVLLMPVERSFV